MTLDDVLGSIIEDFDYMTEEYKNDCRKAIKEFIVSLASDCSKLDDLLAKLEDL